MAKTDADVVVLLVAKKIKDKRKSLGMTQLELSERVSLTRASIANIERGLQNVGIKTLVQIADVFQCDISDLLPKIR